MLCLMFSCYSQFFKENQARIKSLTNSTLQDGEGGQQAGTGKVGNARDKARQKKARKIKSACENFHSVPMRGWDEYLVKIYSILSGD